MAILLSPKGSSDRFISLAYLPEYLSFFALGTVASRRGWLRTLPSSMGKVGFAMALVATILLFPLALSSLSSGAAFLFHIPVIVLLALALRGVHPEQLLKFGLAAILGVPLCFVVASLARRLPLASTIL